jgi:uroporphyrinogen-III synthase
MTPVAPDEFRSLLDELAAGRHEVVIFMNGTAASSLFERAQELGRRDELTRSLRQVTTACRGPKAAAVVRGFGLPRAIGSREPLTLLRLTHALGQLELAGQSVLRLNGDPDDVLAQRLHARRAQVREVYLQGRPSVVRSREGESRYSV